MAIDGRINVDVLFHDTDGTTSLKVVSLQDSTAYTSGKVAIVTGTVGTAAVTVATIGSPLPYRDASGQQVLFNRFDRAAISGSAAVILGGSGFYDNASLRSESGRVSVTDFAFTFGFPAFVNNLNVRAASGTASYTVVLYGT